MQPTLKNRDTRVQIVIIENGKYILLEHLAKKQNVTFWGLPGGGREADESDEEAAVREALEETGLHVRLLPIKHEVNITGKKYIYDRIVTFMAYPLSGEAITGSEPEEELYASYNYKLIDLKWQDLHDDDDLEPFTLGSVQPVRELLATAPLKRIVSGLFYRQTGNGLQLLLGRVQEGEYQFELPWWNVREGKKSEAVIKDKAIRHWGMEVNDVSYTGFFFHEHEGEFYRNDVFRAPVLPGHQIPSDDTCLWMDACKARTLNLSRPGKRMIEAFDLDKDFKMDQIRKAMKP